MLSTLFDPQHLLQKLKRSVEIYPAALQQKMILNCLTTAEFTLSHAHGFADRGDLLNTIGCLTKIAFVLLQSLFALNLEYYFGDKGSLEAVDRFPIQPSFFRPAPGITGDADANTARPQIRHAADSDAMVGDPSASLRAGIYQSSVSPKRLPTPFFEIN
jgi:hypothetical protein